jgi:hypothetical protein
MSALISKADIAKAGDAVTYHCEGLRAALFGLEWKDGQTVAQKHADIHKAFGDFTDRLMRDMPFVPPRPPEFAPELAETPTPLPKPDMTKAAPPAPVDRLTKIAQQTRERDPKLTAEQCITKALEADPAAYDAIERERQVQVRRLGALE